MAVVSIARDRRGSGGALRAARAAGGMLAAVLLASAAWGEIAEGIAIPTGTGPAAVPQPGAPADLPAVGRLLTGGPDGPAACSGALVAPSLVLTAAHCLRSRADGRPRAAGEFHFATGRAEGVRPAVRRGRVLRFAAEAPTRYPTSADVALIELWGEVPAAVATPLPVMAPESAGPPFAFAGYERGARTAGAAWSDPCDRPQDLGGGALGIACDAVSGNSGAPLLGRTDTGWAVIGVMSARLPGEGPLRAIAVRPPADIRAAIAAAAGP